MGLEAGSAECGLKGERVQGGEREYREGSEEGCVVESRSGWLSFPLSLVIRSRSQGDGSDRRVLLKIPSGTPSPEDRKTAPKTTP